MSEMYTVKKGDYLSKIAAEHGIANWKDIYNHKNNSDFKQKRSDPNILMEGDEIFIPGTDDIDTTYKSGQKHEIIIPSNKPNLQLIITEYREPVKINKYELELKGKNNRTITREINKTDEYKGDLSKGKICEEITLFDNEATLKIWLNEETDDDHNPHFIYELGIGFLDPIDEISGIQARLNNLGFNCGKVDNILGPKTKSGIMSFQMKNKLNVDGIPGPITQGKLKSEYGC